MKKILLVVALDSINVGYYFNCIGKDLDYLISGKAKNYDDVGVRVTSLATRIFGGLLLVSAAVSLVSSIALAPISPAASFIGIIGAIFTVVFAHDLIRMGDNSRKITEANDLPNKGFMGSLFALPGAVHDVGNAAAFEADHGIPYVFRETIIAGPFAKFLNSL